MTLKMNNTGELCGRKRPPHAIFYIDCHKTELNLTSVTKIKMMSRAFFGPTVNGNAKFKEN